MKKLTAILFLMFLSLTFVLAKGDKKYYIKDTKEGLQFLCFSKNNCYNLTLDVIKIKNKAFIGFGGYHYFDLNTYQYNKKADTYTVDVLVERDPSGDLGYYNKSPYDNGEISHLLFSLTYVPSKKDFKAAYKGFASSETTVEYQNNKPVKNGFKFLSVYYDNNPNNIQELNDWLNFYNKELIKQFGKKQNSNYDVEIVYLLKHYAGLKF